jgi:hypothetical protein
MEVVVRPLDLDPYPFYRSVEVLQGARLEGKS